MFVDWGEQVSFACGVERKVAAAASTPTTTATTTTSTSALASLLGVDVDVAHLTHAAGFVVGSVSETSARKLVAFFVEAKWRAQNAISRYWHWQKQKIHLRIRKIHICMHENLQDLCECIIQNIKVILCS